MKKSVLYSLMASISIFSVAAYAEGETSAGQKSAVLATKNYVDGGLSKVYQAAKGLINNLAVDVNDNTTNLNNEIINRQNVDSGLSIRIKALEDNLGSTSAAGIAETYATKTGVANTVKTATITVPANPTWGSADVSTNLVGVSAIVNAVYSEPEPEPVIIEEPSEPEPEPEP